MTRDAMVTGIDKSSGMLALARERLGNAAAFLEADLAAPLPFADGAFDRVFAALALHYIEVGAAAARVRRVLVPGGKLVISTHHPFCDHLLAGGHDYFSTFQLDDHWKKAARRWRCAIGAGRYMP